MTEILKLLEEDGRYTASQLAEMTGRDAGEVKNLIAECEKEHIINGYTALVDWDRTNENTVSAFIEVKVTPQRDDGYDRIAARILQYDEVESVCLMSGAFDLGVTVSGTSLKDVANFVSARLSPIEGVLSTATHFILKKYKEKHRVFQTQTEQEERVLFV